MLEALADAYEISGDRGFLEGGMTTFEIAVNSTAARGNIVGRKYVDGDAVIWSVGPGPKAFGAGFSPVMAFYRSAVEAGML